MIGVRQRIGHTIVIGDPTNLDVWSVTIPQVLLVLQPANYVGVGVIIILIAHQGLTIYEK